MTNTANANPHVTKKVLEVLATGPATYAKLAEGTGMPQGTIVQNMNVLVEQGVVIREKHPAHPALRWFFRLPVFCKGCKFDQPQGCPQAPPACVMVRS